MKRHSNPNFEEHEAGIDSRDRNKALIKEFDEVYHKNCERSSKKLTNIQNTALFIQGAVTRLILPPKTHHADNLKRVSENLYVSLKK